MTKKEVSASNGAVDRPEDASSPNALGINCVRTVTLFALSMFFAWTFSVLSLLLMSLNSVVAGSLKLSETNRPLTFSHSRMSRSAAPVA